MSRHPPQRLFKKCLICGEDYSQVPTPKNSMARHLRHQHGNIKGSFDKVTTAYMVKFILKNKVPQCLGPGCTNKVTVKGFEAVGHYCSSVCSSKHQHAIGGAFTDPEKQSRDSKARWQDPEYKARLTAVHNSAGVREKHSLGPNNYWAQPGIRTKRSEGHKAWWDGKRSDKEFMTRRSEISSATASRSLKEHKDFGYARKRKCLYKGLTFRSSWEVALAKRLDELGVSWEYEPQTFKVRPGVRYTPDFHLPDVGLWIEVKPKHFANAKAKEKLRALKAQTGEAVRFADLATIQRLTLQSFAKFL